MAEKWPIAYSPAVTKKVEQVCKFARLVGIEIEPFQKLILRELFSDRQEIVALLPRGNGKTGLMAVVAIHHLLTHPEPAVYCAAASRDQAKILWEEARKLALRNPAVAARITFRHNELRVKNGFMRMLAADAPKVHGLAPTLCFVDELHAHANPHLYVALKTALSKKADSKICVISTAGHDLDGTLGQLRAKALVLPEKFRKDKLTFVFEPEARFSFFEWALQDSDDHTDIKLVKKANPASFVTAEFLSEQLHSPGLPESEYLRYHCNRWAKADAAWLPDGAWDRCYEAGAEIPLHSRITVGVDIGIKHDSTAVVSLWKRPDGKTVVKAKVWTPRGDGTPFDLGIAENYIRQLARDFEIKAVVYDRWSFERSAQILSDEGLLMLEHPMTNARTVPATVKLLEAIKTGQIVHDGDPILAAHVAAGVAKSTERGYRLTKKATNPIDALMALLIAFAEIDEGTSVYANRDLLVLTLDED